MRQPCPDVHEAGQLRTPLPFRALAPQLQLWSYLTHSDSGIAFLIYRNGGRRFQDPVIYCRAEGTWNSQNDWESRCNQTWTGMVTMTSVVRRRPQPAFTHLPRAERLSVIPDPNHRITTTGREMQTLPARLETLSHLAYPRGFQFLALANAYHANSLTLIAKPKLEFTSLISSTRKKGKVYGHGNGATPRRAKRDVHSVVLVFIEYTESFNSISVGQTVTIR